MNLSTSTLAQLATLFESSYDYYPSPDDSGPYGPFGPVMHPGSRPLLERAGRRQVHPLEAARTFTASLLPLHHLELGLPQGELSKGVSQAISSSVARMIDDCGNGQPWWWNRVPHPPKGGDDGEPRPISPLELSVVALEFARVSVLLGKGTLSQELAGASQKLLELGQSR